jgi:hypothetical protein
MILWHNKTRTFVKAASIVYYKRCPPGNEPEGWIVLGWTVDRQIYVAKLASNGIPVVMSIVDPTDIECKWAK